MYIPNSYAETDLPTLHAFIDTHPLAAVVTASSAEGLLASHLPLVLDRAVGARGTLFGHFARANPHARQVLAGPLDALVMFTGPEAYITPEWYRTKQETGKVVPTWNYVAVHVYGVLRAHDDPQFLRQHLETLVHRHESARPRPWQVSDAPEDYIAQQMKAIVAVELVIDRLEGKWKMSQNRSEADIEGVVRGLGATGSAQDHAVARIVSERRPSR
jgi:transcriptional regulator